MTSGTAPLTKFELAAFNHDGYSIARNLFGPDEIHALAKTFDALHARGTIPGCFSAIPASQAKDPLDVYPRMMHPHRISKMIMCFMLHPQLEAILRALLNEQPVAAQSMFYWKPPLARGQALHQDNFYLNVYPGNCIAAWVAIDRADRENGGLFVVPGSHKLALFCPKEADLNVSFATEFVPVPEGMAEVPVDLHPGDVLFFGGNLIHGSQPNYSNNRFRRSFICHYVGESAQEISQYYKPLYRFDGTQVEIGDARGGGPCGTFEAGGPH